VLQEHNKPQLEADHLLDQEVDLSQVELSQVKLAVPQEHNKPQLDLDHLLDQEVDLSQVDQDPEADHSLLKEEHNRNHLLNYSMEVAVVYLALVLKVSLISAVEVVQL